MEKNTQTAHTLSKIQYYTFSQICMIQQNLTLMYLKKFN